MSKRFVTGTIAQLAGTLDINGTKLGQPELSVMTRIFGGTLFKQVGIVKQEGARGRPAIVWQIDTESVAYFGVADAAATAAGLSLSDTDAPAYAPPVAATA